jgi:hypothetical protein
MFDAFWREIERVRTGREPIDAKISALSLISQKLGTASLTEEERESLKAKIGIYQADLMSYQRAASPPRERPSESSSENSN